MIADAGRPTKRWPFAALALICLLVVLLYRPGLGGGFVFDDLPNIVDNRELHVHGSDPQEWLGAVFSSPASSLQRPLAMATFAANHYFTGLDPVPMKATNIAIHVLNALLLFCLLRRLVAYGAGESTSTARRDAAVVLATATWALHPINLTAVLFVVQRMESLSHLFVFAGLLLYVRGRQRQLEGREGWWQVAAGIIGGTVLGLLSKESAVLLPLYALCLELCLFRFQVGSGVKADRRLLSFYVVTLFLPAAAAIAWLLPISLDPSTFAARNFSLGERLLTECRVLVEYLRMLLLPDLGRMGLYHDDYPISRGWLRPVSTLFAAALLSGLLTLAWWLRARRPLAALGLLWFFAAHAMTATILPLELMFEHRNYFAAAGICLALADLLLLAPGAPPLRRVLGLLAVAHLAFCIVLTGARAGEWSNPVRFASTEAAKRPNSPRATYELARVLVVLSQYKASSPYLAPAMQAIERARKVPGSNALPEQAALIVAARTGMPLQEAWWLDLQRKLREQPITPQHLGALNSMAKCSETRACAFPPQQMIEVFSAALSHGDNAEVMNVFGGYALNALGDPALALKLWQEAAQLRPAEPQYRINLAKLWHALGREQEARKEIEALRAIGRLGQNEQAARNLERQLRLPPATRTQ